MGVYTQCFLRTQYPIVLQLSQLLVTNEPLHFDKWLVEIQDFKKITDHLGGNYRTYLKIIKINQNITTCKILTDYSRGTYSRPRPIGNLEGIGLSINLGLNLNLTKDWSSIKLGPIVSWHMSWYWVLKWWGINGINERLWQTLTIGNMIGSTFDFKNSQ